MRNSNQPKYLSIGNNLIVFFFKIWKSDEMKISKSLLIAEENKKTETVHQNDPKILYRIVYNSKQGEPIFEQSITECSDHIHKKLEKLVSFCLQISVVLVNSVIRKLYKRVTGQRIRYLFLNKN